MKNSSYFKDLIIVLFLMLSPFIFFSYNFFPNHPNLVVFNYTIYADYYETIKELFWNIYCSLFLILLFSLWFLTCRYWWRYCILVITLYELKKLANVFYSPTINQLEYYLFIIKGVIIYIPIIIFCSYKFRYRNKLKSLDNDLNYEIENLIVELSHFNTKKYKGLKRELSLLKNKKENLSQKEYLTKLMILQEKIIQKN